MHEYTYQAIANDLLDIHEGVVSYTVQEGSGNVDKTIACSDRKASPEQHMFDLQVNQKNQFESIKIKNLILFNA